MKRITTQYNIFEYEEINITYLKEYKFWRTKNEGEENLIFQSMQSRKIRLSYTFLVISLKKQIVNHIFHLDNPSFMSNERRLVTLKMIVKS